MASAGRKQPSKEIPVFGFVGSNEKRMQTGTMMISLKDEASSDVVLCGKRPLPAYFRVRKMTIPTIGIAIMKNLSKKEGGPIIHLSVRITRMELKAEFCSPSFEKLAPHLKVAARSSGWL